MRLLLIEDSELLQERVLESLAELAPNVLPHTAQTQDDAIQLLRQHQYDLVIADIELAQGNGLDVIRYARTHLPPNHSPVFVVPYAICGAGCRLSITVGALQIW